MTHDPDQNVVEAHFDASAEYWRDVYHDDDLQGLIYRERHAAVLSLLDSAEERVPPACAVDVGCGAGRMSSDLAGRGYMVRAFDRSDAMLALTRQRAVRLGIEERVEVARGDAAALPLPAGQADVVVALGVVPWLDDPERALREWRRVLRPGGHVVFTVDNRARLTNFTDPRASPLLELPRRLWRKRRRPAIRAVSHTHYPRHIDALIQASGLELVARRTTGFGPFMLWGRVLLGERRGVALHHRLQALADRGIPVLRLTGWHYLVLARRPPA